MWGCVELWDLGIHVDCAYLTGRLGAYLTGTTLEWGPGTYLTGRLLGWATPGGPAASAIFDWTAPVKNGVLGRYFIGFVGTHWPGALDGWATCNHLSFESPPKMNLYILISNG